MMNPDVVWAHRYGPYRMAEKYQWQVGPCQLNIPNPFPKKRTVYRLENYRGKGPFSGSKRMAECLITHSDPCDLLDLMIITAAEFDSLTNKGAIFGWDSAEGMIRFFRDKPRSQRVASEMKMKISIYEVKYALDFPDGQVIFVRPETPPVKVSLKQFFSEFGGDCAG